MLYVTLTRAKRLLIAPDGSALYEKRDPNFLSLAHWNELDLPALFTPAPTAASAAVTPAVLKGEPDDTPKLFRPNKSRLEQAALISRRIPRRILPSGLVHDRTAKNARSCRHIPGRRG